jgi:hypothetical protein
MVEPIFFLRNELPNEPEINQGYRWSLTSVKVSQTVGGACIAFTSETLAERFRSIRSTASVVCSTALDSHTYFDFSKMPIVLFETEVQVDACIADRGNFPYEALLARYSLTDGLTKHVGYQFSPPFTA